jgi:murein L,D-transpeptidase YafK
MKRILCVVSCVVSVAAITVHGAGARSDSTLVDSVVVFKAKRQMILFAGGDTLKLYRVALGKSPVGAKQREGDMRTPEGRYSIDSRNVDSKYHRSLHISYPNAVDRRRADSLKVKPGGDIMIHGLPKGYEWLGFTHRYYDWTWGCIAVTNEEIDEIWHLCPDGTPILIYP